MEKLRIFLPQNKLKDQLGMINDKPIYKKTVDGVHYYEHPFYGDSVPMIIKYYGVWYYSHDYLIKV